MGQIESSTEWSWKSAFLFAIVYHDIIWQSAATKSPWNVRVGAKLVNFGILTLHTSHVQPTKDTCFVVYGGP